MAETVMGSPKRHTHPSARAVLEVAIPPCCSGRFGRTGFAEAGLHYDSALAALDLARTAYAEGGRLAEVRTLANEAAVQLTLAGAHSEAFAAQGLLLKAIRDDALTHALLVQVRQRIETLRPS